MRKPPKFLLTACIVTLSAGACVPPSAASKPQLVWVNGADPTRSVDRDDQECELVARQLTAGLFPSKPLFQLAAQQNEWDRCMGGRGWRRVDGAAANDSVRATSLVTQAPDVRRWVAVSRMRNGMVYLDTTQITRATNGALRVWLLHQYVTDERIGPTLIRRLIRQIEVDCGQRRTRNVMVVAYDAAGGTVATDRTEDAPWNPVIPETVDENFVRALCPARSPPH